MPTNVRAISRRDFLLESAVAVAAGTVLGLPSSAAAQEPQLCAPPPAGKPPIPFKPDSSLAILPRKSGATLTTTEITRLRAAYKALRDLRTKDPSDPRGWMHQANVHCWNCGGGLKDTNAPEIHGGWLFLPWHRAYLYFHERILAGLIGDPTFRLPYWDWDHAQRRTLPAAYATPANAGNSLFNPNRSAGATQAAPSFLVGSQIMNGVMNATSFAAFGGDETAAGSIEGSPHGGVHIWVADRTLQSARADMGLLSTAAQDPLFFTHHGNIDRLWSVWNKSAKTHTNPTDKGWLSTAFTFYDENKQWRSITVADVLDHEQSLRYGFEQPGLKESLTQARSSKLDVSGGTIRLPASFGPEAKTTAAAASSVALILDGVIIQDFPNGVIAFFDGNAELAKPTPQSPGYLGYVAIVPRTSTGQAHRHPTARVALDLSTQLKRLAGRTELRLVGVSLSAGPETARKPVPLQVAAAELVEVVS